VTLEGSVLEAQTTSDHPPMESGSSRKVVQGVAWAGAANWGCQVLNFAVYAGLARLLDPATFGLVAIAGVYIAFIQVLVTQGFGMAIIQRKEIEKEHLDSAFWIAMATASLFCLLSLLCGGQIAHFFHEPRVAPVIAWLSFSLFFYALSSIPTAILTRDLDFRSLAVRSLLATIVSGVVGLGMAFEGCGVWSLVGQQLVNAILSCICLWWVVSWRPRLWISRRHLRDLYGFSLGIAGNDILWFFSQRSDQTFVGYGFGSLGLGPYSLASRLVSVLYDGITLPLQSVAFPAFSKLQSESARFERALYKFCEMCSFVSFPVFAGIVAIAPELVSTLFGNKWASAVPILQILAVYGAVRSALAFVHTLMLSKGRAGLYLLTNVILSGLTVTGCLIAVRWSPAAIAVSIIVTMLLYAVIFFVIAQRILGVRIRPLLKAFVFPAVASLLMLIVVSLLRSFIKGLPWMPGRLSVCVVAGIAVYVLAAWYRHPGLLGEIWQMIDSHLLFSRGAGRVDAPPPPARCISQAAPGSPEP